MHNTIKLIWILLLQVVAVNLFAQPKPKPVKSGVYHWADLPAKKDELGREKLRIAAGITNEFKVFDFYAVTVNKKGVLKPAHVKNDLEELVIVKSGQMKCTIGNNTALLGPGSVALIPPLEKQNIENAADTPLTYYVLLFRSKKGMDIERSASSGGGLMLNKDSLPVKETAKGYTIKYFDRPTAMCENYEMHITHLNNKGASHTPHQHVDTEVILMIDGETEMMIDGINYAAGPGDLYIIESGKMHGISNASGKGCTYFAFKWR
ncbi:MAG: cupin domain-containing protein [Ferruginibacter sp.]